MENIWSGILGLGIFCIIVLFLHGISAMNLRITQGAEKFRPTYHMRRENKIDVYLWQIRKQVHYYDKITFAKNKKGNYVPVRSKFLIAVAVIGSLLWAALAAGAVIGFRDSWMEAGTLVMILGLPVVLLLHIGLNRLIGGDKMSRAGKYLRIHTERGEIDAGVIPEDVSEIYETTFWHRSNENESPSQKAYREYIWKIRTKFLLGFAIFFVLLMAVLIGIAVIAKYM